MFVHITFSFCYSGCFPKKRILTVESVAERVWQLEDFFYLYYQQRG